MLVFPVTASPGVDAVVTLRVRSARTTRTSLDADAGSPTVAWTDVQVQADDPRLGPTVTSSFADLQHLLLTDPAGPVRRLRRSRNALGTSRLFGRDSLWAARMMLPFGTELAAGTLRVLARRQGTVVDGDRAEAPGQDPARAAPHGIRRPDERARPAAGLLRHGRRHRRSGSRLLHDAWRWGMPAARGRGAAAEPAGGHSAGSPTTRHPTRTAC